MDSQGNKESRSMSTTMKTTTTFVDYFVISGLESNSDLELVDSVNDVNPLERSYKPKILRHYPETEEWSHLNDEALSRLILPQGLRFCTEREFSTLKPSVHSFIITKEDGSKSSGFSLIFYEEVTNISICHAVHTLQTMYSTEMSCESLTMQRRTTVERPRRGPRAGGSERSRSLPRQYNQRFRSSSTIDLSSASYDCHKDTLYVTKSIALICSKPLISISKRVLNCMYKYINKSDFDVRVLQGFIYNLLFDIPLPSPGRCVRFWSLGEAITLSLPKEPEELPLFDYDLLDFFGILGIDNAVKLLICVLLEHQVLVFSSDFEKLMLVCESVTCLCYPFSWPHVYVPILPPSLENYLDAPVPFIMGLLRRTHDYDLYKRGTVCIVDIDSGELDLPEELPSFPYETELIQEVESVICEYGGPEGAAMIREHKLERLQNEDSNLDDNNDANEDSSALDQLEKMINKFEKLSSASSLSALSGYRSRRHKPTNSKSSEKLRVNNALREVFVNRFVHMFLSFEHFVITPNEMELSLTNQDTTQNFDKVSFLSDQIGSHFPFLASFLESQIFSNFIDDYIERRESLHDTAFEYRMRKMRDRFGENLVRTPTYEKCKAISESEEILNSRFRKIELTVSPPKYNRNNHSGSSASSSSSLIPAVKGHFPLFDPLRFSKTSSGSKKNSAVFFSNSEYRSLQHQTSSLSFTMAAPVGTESNIPKLLNSSPAAIAETQWNFVTQLLQECKQKTKRILLEKLGSEAVEWGHNKSLSEENNFHTEENMLVASLCDLIERIWSHGLINRQRKSAFWHYLYKRNESNLSRRSQLGIQAYCVSFIKNKPYLLPDHARRIQVIPTCSLDSNILATMHNVSTIHQIKSEIGYARAWIRLTLEQKKLSHFLQILLSDVHLLKTLYKRYAFLRSEDEREQSLYYYQTLNTVDFSCFTNAYTKSSLLYQVLIFPSQKSSGASLSSSNVWLHVVGSLGETSKLYIPRGILHFSFWSDNVGFITSLRLGHDNSGVNPNWLIEHVLVKNEFTGQAYKFACGRWLGQNIDDGSTERYMVGYPVSPSTDLSSLVQSCALSPEHPCPATNIKSVNPETEIVEIQTMLGDAINRIIKFYHKSLNEKISYAHLMCGEFGLIHALIYIFSFGYKSARLFGKNLSVWDFFLKVTMDFNQSLAHMSCTGGSIANSPQSSPKRRVPGSGASTLESPRCMRNQLLVMDFPKRTPGSTTTPTGTLSRANQFRRMYTRLITRIETTCTRLGKDDKFQLFVCLAVHDRLLGRIITDLTRAIAVQQLYDEVSFLRDPTLTSFLSHILEALEEISIPVDPALKKTLEQHHTF